MSSLLITFGCSWTLGVAVGYTPGMSRKKLGEIAWQDDICDNFSFRGLLSKKYGLTNKNLSAGGSSNQKQFRLAKEFFSSNEFKELQDKFDQVIVLWGITSTARNEMFWNSEQAFCNWSFSRDVVESQVMVKYFYDHTNEVERILSEMRFWNEYFEVKKIKNLWFDTFNHHNYYEVSEFNDQFRMDYQAAAAPSWPTFDDYILENYSIDQNTYDSINKIKNFCLDNYQSPQFTYNKLKNLIFKEKNPKDLMSNLALQNGGQYITNQHHESNWTIDTPTVKYLVDLGILNPSTCHPTQIGHAQIANMLSPYIETFL